MAILSSSSWNPSLRAFFRSRSCFSFSCNALFCCCILRTTTSLCMSGVFNATTLPSCSISDNCSTISVDVPCIAATTITWRANIDATVSAYWCNCDSFNITGWPASYAFLCSSVRFNVPMFSFSGRTPNTAFVSFNELYVFVTRSWYAGPYFFSNWSRVIISRSTTSFAVSIALIAICFASAGAYPALSNCFCSMFRCA